MGRNINNKTVYFGCFAKLEKMKNLGKSRDLGKMDGTAKAKIFSYNSYGKYKTVARGFSEWCKGRGIEKYGEVTKDVCEAYLRCRQALKFAPATVESDMTALNKLFGYELTKKEVGLKPVRVSEITKGRSESAYSRHVNEENYRDQIDMVRATGMRRASVLRISKENFVKGDNGVYAIVLKEKGGKVRTSIIRRDMFNRVNEILVASPKKANEPLFDRYPKAINSHRFRREYAQELYKGHIEGKYSLEDYYIAEAEKDRLEKLQEKGKFSAYDVKALKFVTLNLGHNRLGVCVDHYL